MSKVYILVLSLIFWENIYSQDMVLFKNVAYGKPFISELRSPIIKLEGGFLNQISPIYYNKNVNSRMFIESRFGYELNILSIKTCNFRTSFSFPGGLTVLTDLFEEKTAPVINTDYWFGTQFKCIIKLKENKRLLRNIALNFQPIFHESTHLGDEFVLHGYQTVSNFKRINVSYEAYALHITLNDPDTALDNMLSLKAGITGVWSKQAGYYFTDSIEVKGMEVRKNNPKPEFSFLINYQRTDGILCSKNIMNIISLEVSNRQKFSYDKNVPETRVFSLNSYIGWKFKVSDMPFSNIGLFLRYYYGLNPHGQFRDNENFRFTSLSVALM